MNTLKNTLILCICAYLFINLYSKPVAAEVNEVESMNNYKNMDINTKNKIKEFPITIQKKLVSQATELNSTFSVIDEIYGGYENFSENGTIHLSEDGQIIVGLKSSLETEKTNSLKSMLKSSDEDNLIQIKSIKYSTKELEDIQDDITLVLQKSLVDKSFITDLDVAEPKITISVENLTLEDQKKLFSQLKLKSYYELIRFTSHDSSLVPQDEIKRDRDWTKLGGGIKIKRKVGNVSYSCSTTGIGRKGTNYFLITAGHCLDSNGTNVYQSDSLVGVVHTRGNYANIDVGLIRVTNSSPITRYATSYFYNLAENKNDYDKRVTGSSTPIQGQAVCKSGITTGVTCGNIWTLRTTYSVTDGTVPGTRNVAKIVPLSGVNYSEGGDSGAITYDPTNDRIVGIHTGGAGYNGYMTRINDVVNLFSASNNPFTIYSGTTDVLLVSK